MIFRRDLRLQDNSALIKALQNSEQVIFVFCLDENLIKPERVFANSFLLASLRLLKQSLAEYGATLQCVYGKPCETLPAVIKQCAVDAVFFNRDYSPYAKKRDQTLSERCVDLGVSVHEEADLLLQEPGSVLKGDGLPLHRIYALL